MRIAVYGGSFNPPHVAHAHVARWLLESGQVDEVWIVPVFQHAFDGLHSKRLAPFDVRVAWCQAMARDLGERVKVEDIESTLDVPSYTIDTLDHLSRSHPTDEFRLVVGVDILGQVENWKEWERIESDYAPIVVGRAGHGDVAGAPTFPEVSSTQVRERLAGGMDIDGLVTPSVALCLSEDHPWTT